VSGVRCPIEAALGLSASQMGSGAWILLAITHLGGDARQTQTHERDAPSIPLTDRCREIASRRARPAAAFGRGAYVGKLYRRVGRLDEAHAELPTAVAMLREMGMAFWLPEAERELAGAGG
jgi:hypothetical protein